MDDLQVNGRETTSFSIWFNKTFFRSFVCDFAVAILSISM